MPTSSAVSPIIWITVTSANSTSSTGRSACSERCASATARPINASTTSTFAPCRQIPSTRSAGYTPGWTNRSATNSNRGCAPGGPRRPWNESPARTPTRWRSASISTRSGRCSPTTSQGACMAIDLTGGIDPAREQVFAHKPDDPEMRDSVSFWVVDDRGAVGLPRIGIEAVAANWAAHDVQVNVAFPDGRVFRLRDNGSSWPVVGPDGRPTVLGAGGLGFRCIEPFDTWTMTFVGEAVQTCSQDLIDGKKDGPLVDVSFHVDAKMAVPPWVQGALSAEADSRLKTSIEGNLMGGPRYEQLFRATGAVKVGDDEREFVGTGLRIRRQGVRKLAGFWG